LTNNSELEIIEEGTTTLWTIPQPGETRKQASGPGVAKVPIFFNRAMEFSRDLSILVLDNLVKECINSNKKRMRILDGLAGTGARGVRFANELKNLDKLEVEILVNDLNPLAFGLIKKNIELNNLSNVEPTNYDLNSLLVRNRFDYIDIDPFGSPVKFLDLGTRMVRDQGILAVTATDTATLFGTYPKTCLRRYDAFSCRAPFSHEQGTRILIGAVVRTAAKHNVGLFPILSHSNDYYYRIYLRGYKGRKAADDAMGNLGYFISQDKSNNFRVLSRKQFTNNNKFNLAGPLWIGSLYDIDFLQSLDLDHYKLGTGKQMSKYIALWHEESGSPPGFYNANKLASELKISTPQLSTIISSLQQQGFLATRTHFSPNAFKSNAPYNIITTLLNTLSK
jgi:tRNA (guanine26-N2/guanine27-N2)-dimethyltransferase